MQHKIKLQTNKHAQMIDITAQIQATIKPENMANGMLLVYCPHTTAAITINENADPDVILEKPYPAFCQVWQPCCHDNLCHRLQKQSI